MANEKHLTRLKKGGKGWNAWREKHREVRPDLKGADFSGADLSGIDLVEAYLSKANLSKANLAKAQLVETDLSQANLCEANLTEAVLIGAHLEAADLKAANLVDADLIEANLHGADLRGTNLQGILLFETILTDTNLTGARGLDSCSHGGPSTIDFRTLMKSGRLPLEFLRGCGLPDNFIEYLPSLLNEPLQFYSCFISYSTKDQEFAERLHADLQNKGVRCWFAPHDIQGGKKLHEQIDQAIRVHDRLLLLLSEHSMNSEWVKTEIANARRRE